MLMATVPGPTMSSLDVARLRHLAHLARRRLGAEPGAGAHPDLEQRLARAIAAAEGNPTDRGVAILVSAAQVAIFPLPFAPRDRVAVDPRFATRDLEFALQHYPRYRVVVLGSAPRLLEGRAHFLVDTVPEATGRGPVLFGSSRRGLGRRSVRPEHWQTRRVRLAAGCAEADRLLDQRIGSSEITPLIVVGDNRWLAEFRQRSRHAEHVVAEVRGSRIRASAADLAGLAQPGLAAWRQTQQARRLAELHDAEAHGSVMWGLRNAWRAVRDGQADRLWIEHGYAQPGWRVPGVEGIEPTTDPAQPGVSDDLVDDLTQMAAARGIAVDLVDDDCIVGPEPIATRVIAAQRHLAVSAAADDADNEAAVSVRA